MKCPKCSYLGFEDVDRCRNCGYDFSLTPPTPVASTPDLVIRREAATPASALPDTADDLPLFGASALDDAPLITKASPPRAPLAVRRASRETPRLRSGIDRPPMLELTEVEQVAMPAPADVHDRGITEAGGEPAALTSRMAAAAIDLLVLGAIDLVVIYFTLRMSGLTVADLAVLPKGPLLAFLALQNLGYLVGFTVGGQTLGKMATGIKVIPIHTNQTLDLGHSILRTLVWIALAVPAGLGFLTTLMGQERRGLHDLCAGTKVVRAH